MADWQKFNFKGGPHPPTPLRRLVYGWSLSFLNFLRQFHRPVSLGVPCVPWHTQILSDQFTIFQPGGTDYAHLITTGTPGFSDLPTALYLSPAIHFYSDWLQPYFLRANCPNIYFACEYFSHDQSIVWDFLKNNHINHR